MYSFHYLFLFMSCLLIIETNSSAVINRNQTTIPRVSSTVESKVSRTNKTKIFIKSKTPTAKIEKPVVTSDNKLQMKMITPEQMKDWAKKISDQFFETENHVVQRDFLIKSLSDYKPEIRNGAAIVTEMAQKLEDLLNRRTEAAVKIMRAAENLSQKSPAPTPTYQFDSSIKLGEVKPTLEKPDKWEYANNCSSFGRVPLRNNSHFDALISLERSSVQVSSEVFGCDDRVLPDIYWSEQLLPTFRENYAADASTAFQYFCSYKGFLRHYPAASWTEMYKVLSDVSESNDLYDCRLRSWYVSAGGAPRDILILADASGSLNRTKNMLIEKLFIQALLTALTDDDQVNVLRFNVDLKSLIPCFDDKLVSANHVNAAAMNAALQDCEYTKEANMEMVLEQSVQMLQRLKKNQTRPAPCQQAIVLLTDNVYANHSDLMRQLDPDGEIRVFVLWLHDPNGIRDNTRSLGPALACHRDGVFAEFTTESDVTEQVMRILRVLERPLVMQRKERFTVFSDVYAHMEDPRRGEYSWKQKENDEQKYRYTELRRDKEAFLDSARQLRDYEYQESLETKGQYYEGEDVNYRLQISVSVPVFDYITSENITTRLMPPDKRRKSTRTYPVNRLLGVAGVDIPIDHLKLLLPYHELGGGGSLFIVDHRGNIVLHDNLKPLFDGDILKPGYRTVDFVDLEQPAVVHEPRHYPRDWLEFRKEIIIDSPSGNRTVRGAHILEGGMRLKLEDREYHWRRVLDHYTAVVVLPKYNRRKITPDVAFTQKIAEAAEKTLYQNNDFNIHPDWLYCRHVDPQFDNREREFGHFLRRRKDEPNFVPNNLKHFFSPIEPTLFEKTYHCDERLMGATSAGAASSALWARRLEELPDCLVCKLGSTTAFFAAETGLTRWQQKDVPGAHETAPPGSEWPRGPTETWYQRAVATPDILVIHAPVLPISRFRNTDKSVPTGGIRARWLTAARWAGGGGGGGGGGAGAGGTAGVAGYHFHPRHLEDFVEGVIHHEHCDPSEPDCEARCNGEEWACYLIDDEGWILSTEAPSDEDEESPVRRHLATANPLAMATLLNEGVFKLHWLHDYQAVCFQYEPKENDAAPRLTSMLRRIWTGASILLVVMQQMISVLTHIGLAQADTEIEKAKRRNRVKKDFEREQYDTLYSERVLVNRTRYAACDRSRPLYLLQPSHLPSLSRPAQACSRPVLGAVVPNTNLLLLAVMKLCPHSTRPVNDPMVNEPFPQPGASGGEGEEAGAGGEGREEGGAAGAAAGRLACGRHRVPLPGRAPRAACAPHRYSQEEGYRQCGPWLPDPDLLPEDD